MITGKSIAKGAIVVMAATLLSRLFGFIREMVIANNFGLTSETDAYLVAFAVPSGIAMAIASGISAGFIPVLNSYLVKNKRDDADTITSTLINVLAVLLLLVVAVTISYAPLLVELLAPGFEGDSIPLTAEMIRIMFPALVFVSLMGIASGFLNSHQHFLFPALGPMITSIIIIASAIVLGPVMGIRGLAVGTTAGFACQFVLQLPVMYKKGFRYRMEFAIGHPGVIRVFKLMLPVLIASLAPSLLLIVERGLASGLDTGSISALNYAYRLMQLPLGLFLMAVTVPIFPALSAFAAQNRLDRLRETLVKGIKVISMIMLPACAGLIALSVPIVRLLFERGAFDASNTVPTAYALSVYALALLPFSVRDIFRRGFYSLQNTFIPVVITVAAFILNVLLDFILIRFMGIGGLAMGAVLTALIEAAALYILLSGRLGALQGKNLIILLLKLFAASVVMGVLTYFCSGILGLRVDLDSGMGRLIQVGASVFLGIIVYLIGLLVLKVPEIQEAIDMLRGVYKKVI
ncbi:murein biosynthesis integral membrane protein MurJ [Phosphitispora sp. TUW77]|uniref:murein biosynthesis integral membrane protein MurJ n=1 Tax=Phosphitispora sp. TUW77 TaxID=3152361 RepID=UPI003AB7688D